MIADNISSMFDEQLQFGEESMISGKKKRGIFSIVGKGNASKH